MTWLTVSRLSGGVVPYRQAPTSELLRPSSMVAGGCVPDHSSTKSSRTTRLPRTMHLVVLLHVAALLLHWLLFGCVWFFAVLPPTIVFAGGAVLLLSVFMVQHFRAGQAVASSTHSKTSPMSPGCPFYIRSTPLLGVLGMRHGVHPRVEQTRRPLPAVSV